MLRSFASLCLQLICGLALFTSLGMADSPIHSLAERLSPWIEVAAGEATAFDIAGTASVQIDGQLQDIRLRLTRFDQESFDIAVDHAEYAVAIRRREDGIAFALPRHGKVYLGRGVAPVIDHLKPQGLIDRTIDTGTSLAIALPILQTTDAEGIAGALISMVGLNRGSEPDDWTKDRYHFRFEQGGKKITAVDGSQRMSLELLDATDLRPAGLDEWPDMQVLAKDRLEIEQQLARGARRTLEILLPSAKLTKPATKNRKIDHGELKWVDGQRVAILWGTPEEVGTAHGRLLKTEAMRCIDSVIHAFGTVQTISTGRWFRDDLKDAHARLAPYIPERHRQEIAALARSMDVDEQLLLEANVFPELFHCSGFALFGKATKDGKLIHGRVLDYMTAIGLQDCATTFICSVDGGIPFANVGYAGFIGSVSGMNVEQISLGEMGGRGEGHWDGVPMATLMRRALEECSTLEQVMELWQNSPRTCEYYYVFADGKTRSAVGVAATPEKIEFVHPGQSHELLGDGIPDAVVLSAGSRLEELRRRVQKDYGTFDEISGQQLMCRPVAMSSNLHNVLFVPEDGVLFVANASHDQPAADRPYTRIDLRDLLRSIPGNIPPAKETVSLKSRYTSEDTWVAAVDDCADAQECLKQLCWPASKFEVTFEPARADRGDLLVRFPSPIQTEIEVNNRVAMEWYQAKNRLGEPIVAPAIVVVHESGSNMEVGRLIAKTFRSHGIHAFLIQLPFYGERRPQGGRPSVDHLFSAMKQGICDVRRARDAVVAIPIVDSTSISLQGTSLGGFVTATTAGLDTAYHHVFVFLAGGDLYSVITHGKKDAAKFREELERTGLTDDELKQMLHAIEPLRLAHRIPATRTWVYSGIYDDVVPPSSSEALVAAARLDDSHHVRLHANHYSGILLLPSVVKQISELIVSESRSR